MRCAIELFFDNKSEKSVRSFTRKLERRGITSYLLDVGSRPHLALSVFETSHVKDVQRAVEKFARRTEQFCLSFESLGMFPDCGALFLAPWVTRELLKIHLECTKIIRPHVRKIEDYYKPGKLVFHCTLGMKMSRAMLLRAASLAMGAKLPSKFRVMEIGLVELTSRSRLKVNGLSSIRLK